LRLHPDARRGPRQLGVAAIFGPGTNIPAAASEILRLEKQRVAAWRAVSLHN